jgi:hypothetical protein
MSYYDESSYVKLVCELSLCLCLYFNHWVKKSIINIMIIWFSPLKIKPDEIASGSTNVIKRLPTSLLNSCRF